MLEGFAEPLAPLFDASPNCPASTFVATAFAGTGGVDTPPTGSNSRARKIEEYTALLYTGAGSDTGLITNIFNGGNVSLYYDTKNQRWTNAEGYLTTIRSNTDITHTAHYLDQQNTATTSALSNANVSEQTRFDNELLFRTKAEYCMYRMYYNGFLTAFIGGLNDVPGPTSATTTATTSATTTATATATATTTTEATLQAWLEILISMNTKLNALVGLIDYIANRRSGYVFARGSAIDKLNEEIQAQVAASPVPAELMKSKENILNTRKEMIRYTKEKNNSISNHVSLWAALNVVAVAMIFTLYRKI